MISKEGCKSQGSPLPFTSLANFPSLMGGII